MRRTSYLLTNDLQRPQRRPEILHAAPAGDEVAEKGKYLPTIPTDIFAEGAPLHYYRKGGGYVLYSVGANLKDDDGKEGGWLSPDIVVRVSGK